MNILSVVNDVLISFKYICFFSNNRNVILRFYKKYYKLKFNKLKKANKTVGKQDPNNLMSEESTSNDKTQETSIDAHSLLCATSAPSLTDAVEQKGSLSSLRKPGFNQGQILISVLHMNMKLDSIIS